MGKNKGLSPGFGPCHSLADPMPEPAQKKIAHTDTPKSRSASFKLVFKSVLGLRCPMIRAHGTWYSPAGNCLGMEPGMTTERGGT